MNELNIKKILDCLPHRYPFILVDRVLDYEVGKSLLAIKNVTINEPHFVGHFPDHPIMPGVLILEALAQACAILAHLSDETGGGKKIHLFAGIDNARFKQIVTPGDQMHLHVAMLRKKQDIWKMQGTVMVDGNPVCSAELMSAMREL